MAEKIANLEYYLKMHKKYPKLRFFVPLADLYHRFGYSDEALQILKEGLKWHPNYFVARALLARILEETGHSVQAHLEAEKVVQGDSDNLLGLHIFIKTSEKLKKPQTTASHSNIKIKKLESILSHIQLRSRSHEISS